MKQHLIDFSATAEQNGIIEYYNQNGEVVKTYPIEKLDNFVYEHGMNKDEESVEKYIDNNWSMVTEVFYNEFNPSGHVAKNTEQETLRDMK